MQLRRGEGKGSGEKKRGKWTKNGKEKRKKGEEGRDNKDEECFSPRITCNNTAFVKGIDPGISGCNRDAMAERPGT